MEQKVRYEGKWVPGRGGIESWYSRTQWTLFPKGLYEGGEPESEGFFKIRVRRMVFGKWRYSWRVHRLVIEEVKDAVP